MAGSSISVSILPNISIAIKAKLPLNKIYSRFLRYLLQPLVSLYHMATSNPVANNTLVDQYWLHAKLL